MNNDINENNNKSIQDTFENPPKISIYKINILASVENANINENINEGSLNNNKQTNGSKKNLLFLDTFSNKKKSKKNNIKNILESSFRSKKRSSLADQEKDNDNLKDGKSNIIVINSIGNEIQNKDSDFYSCSFISPRGKNKLIRENNESEFKLSKLAEQLYENEEHFQKDIISKKRGLNDSINTIKKNDSFISEEIIKKKRRNNMFLNVEPFDKDNSNANLLKDYKRRKSNVSSSSKGKSSNYNIKNYKKKNNFSNFKKNNFKNEAEKKGDGEEYKNKNKKNSNMNLKQNLSSKILRIYDNKKTMNENNEIKNKNTRKKSSNKIKSDKSQINDDTKKGNNAKNKKKENKNQKFRFFCCLNNNDNDSDENCN